MVKHLKFRKSFLYCLLWVGWMALALRPFFWENASAFCGLVDSFMAIGTASLYWALALGLGWRSLKWLNAFDPRSQTLRALFSRLVLSCGIGLGLLAALVLGVGTWVGVGAPTFYITFLPLVALIGTAWVDLAMGLKRTLRLLRSRSWKPVELAGCAVVVGIICLQLPAALTPTLYPDTWRYHFGLTRLFEQAGRISIIPDFAEANIASNWQMIYLPILVLSGDSAAQVFNWMVLFPLALVVALAARVHGWVVACLTLVCTPLLLGVAGLGNNDLGVAFFAALMWMALSGSELSAFGFRLSRWLLAGVFGGLAIGTKYNAALAVLPVFILSLFSQRPGEKGLQGVGGHGGAPQGIRFLLGVFLGYLPWFIRNGGGTGDPFYPVLSRWLPWVGEEGRWVAEHYARELATYGAGAGWLERLLLALWHVTVADPKLHYESDIGVIFWCMTPLILCAAWRRPASRPVILTALLGGLMWSLTGQVTRFLAPLIPIAALSVAEGWQEFTDGGQMQGGTRATTLRSVFLVLMGINVWQGLTSVAGFSDPYHFLLQGMRREAYLEKSSPLYRMARWVEKQYPGRKVLLLGEEGVFVFRNPVVISGPFDQKWIVKQVASSQSANELTKRLSEANIQLLCVNEKQMEGLDHRFGYVSWRSKRDDQHFKAYLRNAAVLAHEEVTKEGSIRLYHIGP